MRVTVTESGKPERVFRNVSQHVVNTYISSMSDFRVKVHIRVEDDHTVLLKPITEMDYHGGES